MSIFAKLKKAEASRKLKKTTTAQDQTKSPPVPYIRVSLDATQDASCTNPLTPATRDIQSRIASTPMSRAMYLEPSQATRRSIYYSSNLPCAPSQPPSTSPPSSISSGANTDLSITSAMQRSTCQPHQQIPSGHTNIPPTPMQYHRRRQTARRRPYAALNKSSLSHVSVAEESESDEQDEPSSGSSQDSMNSVASSVSSRAGSFIQNSNSKHIEPYHISMLPPTSMSPQPVHQRSKSTPPVSQSGPDSTRQTKTYKTSVSARSSMSLERPTLPQNTGTPHKSNLSQFSRPQSQTLMPSQLTRSQLGHNRLIEEHRILLSPQQPQIMTQPRISMSSSASWLFTPSPPDVTCSTSDRPTEVPQTPMPLLEHKTYIPVVKVTQLPLQADTDKTGAVVQMEKVQTKSRLRRSFSFFPRKNGTVVA